MEDITLQQKQNIIITNTNGKQFLRQKKTTDIILKQDSMQCVLYYLCKELGSNSKFDT
jgi:hypothetical protein